MRHVCVSELGQHLFIQMLGIWSAKPWPESMLTYGPLRNKHRRNVHQIKRSFLSIKCISRYHLQNVGHFIQASLYIKSISWLGISLPWHTAILHRRVQYHNGIYILRHRGIPTARLVPWRFEKKKKNAVHANIGYKIWHLSCCLYGDSGDVPLHFLWAPEINFRVILFSRVESIFFVLWHTLC